MQAYHQTPAVSAGTASKSSRAGAAASYPAIGKTGAIAAGFVILDQSPNLLPLRFLFSGRAIRLGEFSQIRDWLVSAGTAVS
jgi:hypothetical protein